MILDISSIDRLFSWQEYLEFSRNLFDAQGRTTSESDTYNTTEILDYTKLNFARINRVNKQFDFSKNLENTISEIPTKWRWIMLAESWCGDVAQVGPVISQIAESSENIEFSVVLRDKNIGLMDKFLTNGGRSIPKLICLEPSTYQVIGSWGPRPQALQELLNIWSSEPLTLMQKAEKLHKWYADDKTEHTQLELNEVLKQWIAHSSSFAYTPAVSR
jgi:hypothetical protein